MPPEPSDQSLVGVISDTHGLLRPQALTALAGVDLILHAGDVGDPAILTALREIAPVWAVRGNTDYGPWAQQLRRTEVVTVAGAQLYMLHDLNDLDLDAARVGLHAIITGHTHRPVIDWRDGVLYLNPGSAGPRRFDLPVTLAHLRVAKGVLHPRLIHLSI